MESSDDAAEQRLAEIAAVTDSEIARFDVDDLLDELLARVVSILDADTAAVLLLNESGQLVARAALGIEEEVRQGVRVPLGVGFAGRVAADRRPVRLDQVDASTVHNPILWQKGIRKMLGVPLVAGTRLLGVLHVGRVADDPFTDHDTALLELVGARVAAAVQARQLDVERAAARVVQRGLLPDALPECQGVDFATRFVPAGRGGVGGDWYDAFVLPDGVLWVMTGDVAGHGLDAAVTMSRLRAALRSYALDGNGPDQVLALADRKLQFFDPGKMATVVCGRAPSPYQRVELASAGHLPPVSARPGQPATLLDLPASPPIGVSDEQPQTAVAELPAGALLLFYTDGLVERRGEGLDVGLDRLTKVVTADNPETVCRTVMAALVGPDTPEDDIAVLALRRRE